jgi:hypothetical protein
MMLWQRAVAYCFVCAERHFAWLCIQNQVIVLRPLALLAFFAMTCAVQMGVRCKLPLQAVLLDQNRIVSGVGNWVVDEVSGSNALANSVAALINLVALSLNYA